jgi:hypothetical protein
VRRLASLLVFVGTFLALGALALGALALGALALGALALGALALGALALGAGLRRACSPGHDGPAQ